MSSFSLAGFFEVLLKLLDVGQNTLLDGRILVGPFYPQKQVSVNTSRKPAQADENTLISPVVGILKAGRCSG